MQSGFKKGRDSLTRKELVSKMQKEHLSDLGLSNKVITKIVNSFLDTYKDSILNNERVEIRGFGIMKTELIPGRLIFHPLTKEQTPASPHYRLSFVPCQSFRTQLKERAKKEASRK